MLARKCVEFQRGRESPLEIRACQRRLRNLRWMSGYGDYPREVGYALKRPPVQWKFLGYSFD